ncbi:hypothetical protein QQ045_028325 [Rhodiola kirilowii]
MGVGVSRGRGIMEGGCGLPDHIIFCILLHLPVKCLIRFKTVSKTWNALITDSCFVRQHHSLQPSSKLLLARTGAHIYPIPLTFDAISKDLRAHPNVYKPFEQSIPNPDFTWLMGPYYGVFCFAVFCYRGPVRITLCNIATRESKDLPCLNYSNLVVTYAFGFGCVDNHTAGVPEFKVVRLAYVTNEGSKLKCVTHVYTSATNSWKSIEPCQSFTDRQGIEMNGVIHWRAISLTETNILNFNFIRTFNLKAEVFGRIEVPNNISRYALLLTKQNYQFLSLISTTPDNYDEIWVMRGGSWVKQARIGPPGIDTRALIGNWRCLEFDESGVLVQELNRYWLNLGLLPWEVCCDGWRMLMPLVMPLGEDNRYTFFVTGFFDFAESLVSLKFIE